MAMSLQKQRLIEEKIHYDNLRKEQEKLVQERNDLVKQANEVANKGLSKFFLFRLVQVVMRPLVSLVKAVLDLPRSDREVQLLSLGAKEDMVKERLKDVEKQIKGINKEQNNTHSFDTITSDDLLEYRETILARENEINCIRVDNQKAPSRILDEFSQIKGWDEPINKHKILDFVLEKHNFINKFLEEYKKGNLAFEYDGKKYTSLPDDAYRTIYSDEVDIKDIEAALSYALGQDVMFDFRTMRYVGETFEAELDGEIAFVNKGDISPEKVMILKEYSERLSQTIEAIAKDKHPDLLQCIPKQENKPRKERFTKKNSVSKNDYDVRYYNSHKAATRAMVANKCFVESKIAIEFGSMKDKKTITNPHHIMDYLFAKHEYMKDKHFSEQTHISCQALNNTYNFYKGFKGKTQILSNAVGLKDIESALTYAVDIPMHYDFQSRTFKSALFEIDEKGNFVHSETMPPEEYRKLSKFFKTYGEKTSNLFREIAHRDTPSLLYSPSEVKTEAFKDAILRETETKREQYERSNKWQKGSPTSNRRARSHTHTPETEPTSVIDVAPKITKEDKSNEDGKGYRGETMIIRDYDKSMDEFIANTPSYDVDINVPANPANSATPEKESIWGKTYGFEIEGEKYEVMFNEPFECDRDDYDNPTASIGRGLVIVNGQEIEYEEYSPYDPDERSCVYIETEHNEDLPAELRRLCSDLYFGRIQITPEIKQEQTTPEQEDVSFDDLI